MRDIKDAYRHVLSSDTMTSQEKAGYLVAASRMDHEIPSLTIEEARRIVAEAEQVAP